MIDYTELVKALRCGEYKPECGSSDCPYWSGLGCMDGQLMEDAAAAIEALQAKVDALKHDIERYVQMNTELLNDRPELEEIGGKWVWKEPKRGKWVMMRQSNGGHYKGCSACHAPMPTDTMLDYLDDADCKWCYSCGAKMEVQDGKD